MKQIDQTGLFLCDLQAQAFEASLDLVDSSSEIFIRRFMNSQIAKLMDGDHAADAVLTPQDILIRIDEQYGVTSYGSVRYTRNELHWIGYMYRYFAYVCGRSSSQVFKLVKPKELREMYPACHTMDCAQALERVLEAKDITVELDIEAQYKVFRRIRKETA